MTAHPLSLGSCFVLLDDAAPVQSTELRRSRLYTGFIERIDCVVATELNAFLDDIQQKLVASVHDISEGGLFVNLLESGFNNHLGFEVKQTDASIRKDAFWFGEAQSRVVVTVSPEKLDALKAACGKNVYAILGSVTESTIQVDGDHWGGIENWKDLYDSAIEKFMVGAAV